MVRVDARADAASIMAPAAHYLVQSTSPTLCFTPDFTWIWRFCLAIWVYFGMVEDGLVHISCHVPSGERQGQIEVRVALQCVMFRSRSFATERCRAGER